jgi:hypothetical protein
MAAAEPWPIDPELIAQVNRRLRAIAADPVARPRDRRFARRVLATWERVAEERRQPEARLAELKRQRQAREG